MTTICYKNYIIAYDGRKGQDFRIIDDDYDKKIEKNGLVFFGAGSVSGISRLIKLYCGEDTKEPIEANALVLDNKELFFIGFDPNNEPKDLWRIKVGFDKTFALGSGEEYAYTAMDMGATAEEAVQWAMKRDMGTGGTIRTFDIKKYFEVGTNEKENSINN